MAKSKYESNVAPHLGKIEVWARAGATEKEIAEKLHIAYSTLRKYMDLGNQGDERYTALSAAFAQACEEPDDHVEAALYKRACGFEYVETKREQRVDRAGNIVELVTTTAKTVPPDPTSAMFWLANRRPDRWQYKPEGRRQEEDEDEGGGVVVLTPVMEAPDPPEEESGHGDG